MIAPTGKTAEIEPRTLSDRFWKQDTIRQRNSIRLAKFGKEKYGHLLKQLKQITTDKLKMENPK